MFWGRQSVAANQERPLALRRKRSPVVKRLAMGDHGLGGARFSKGRLASVQASQRLLPSHHQHSNDRETVVKGTAPTSRTPSAPASLARHERRTHRPPSSPTQLQRRRPTLGDLHRRLGRRNGQRRRRRGPSGPRQQPGHCQCRRNTKAPTRQTVARSRSPKSRPHPDCSFCPSGTVHRIQPVEHGYAPPPPSDADASNGATK